MSQPFHDLPNARVLSESLVVSGQPDHGHLAQACEAGCSMVINLRPQEEHAEFDEANIVQELGMVYVHIPVQGPDDITVENARRLAQALVDCERGQVVAHCGSGNRVGALLALAAHHLDEWPQEQALQYGLDAGLNPETGVYTAVLTSLGLDSGR